MAAPASRRRSIPRWRAPRTLGRDRVRSRSRCPTATDLGDDGLADTRNDNPAIGHRDVLRVGLPARFAVEPERARAAVVGADHRCLDHADHRLPAHPAVSRHITCPRSTSISSTAGRAPSRQPRSRGRPGTGYGPRRREPERHEPSPVMPAASGRCGARLRPNRPFSSPSCQAGAGGGYAQCGGAASTGGSGAAQLAASAHRAIRLIT